MAIPFEEVKQEVQNVYSRYPYETTLALKRWFYIVPDRDTLEMVCLLKRTKEVSIDLETKVVVRYQKAPSGD